MLSDRMSRLPLRRRVTRANKRAQKSSKRLRQRARLGAAEFVRSFAGDALHAKQLEAMTTTLEGTLESGRLSITAVGRALGEMCGEQPKHHVKKVDRFIGNDKIDDHQLQQRWARQVIGGLTRVVVAIDWTDFDDDGQAVIAISAIGDKGRATPLVWETVEKSKLKKNRNRLETLVIERLHEAVDESVEVILLADRGFGDVERYAQLQNLGWYFVIRFRAAVHMALTDDGKLSPAGGHVPKSGRAKLYARPVLTAKRAEVAGVVAIHKKGMKDAWLLAAHLPADLMKAKVITNLYAKRFRIEETFRDLKDPRFGVGFSTVKVTTPLRRNRFLLLQAMAHAMLELLGQAGENLGMHKGLQANTSKKRQLSLFRQGQFWVRAIWNRPEEDELKMLAEFGRLVQENTFFGEVFEAMK